MSRSRGHPFNIEAVEVFAEDFLRRVKEGWYQDPPVPEEFLTETSVISAVTDHLKHVFSVYKRVSSPNTPDNRQKEAKRLERASRSVRKSQVRARHPTPLNYPHTRISFMLLDYLRSRTTILLRHIWM